MSVLWWHCKMESCMIMRKFMKILTMMEIIVMKTTSFMFSQEYAICIRRARSYCSICYTPQVTITHGSLRVIFDPSGVTNWSVSLQCIAVHCSGQECNSGGVSLKKPRQWIFWIIFARLCFLLPNTKITFSLIISTNRFWTFCWSCDN